MQIYYKTPKNMRIVDMCMWIDENIYKEGCDENIAFEYMYHIGRSLAKKKKFFKTKEAYDDFGIFFATRLWMRYRQKTRYNKPLTQEEIDQRKIDSVLNFTKHILYPVKVDFEQQYYAQLLTRIDKESDRAIEGDRINDAIMESLELDYRSDFNTYLHDVCSTIKAFLKSIPIQDKTVWNNIYLSCLLSFLNSVTLSKRQLTTLANTTDISQKIEQSKINRLYDEARENSVILYHLDDSMKDYVDILYRRLRHIIAKDISEIINFHIPHDINDKLILLDKTSLVDEENDYEN